MKKAIVVLIMIVGIFTSCEQKEELVIDCGCVETTYDNHFEESEDVFIIKETSKIDVECQEESFNQTYEITITVNCKY
tara:strand:+ start:504 stop:737 length:234 start_codon:yes stop_codon:yes gene_type:complete